MLHIVLQQAELVDQGLTQNHEGPVKLVQWVKIAHSFSQSLPDQFHVFLQIKTSFEQS